MRDQVNVKYRGQVVMEAEAGKGISAGSCCHFGVCTPRARAVAQASAKEQQTTYQVLLFGDVTVVTFRLTIDCHANDCN